MPPPNTASTTKPLMSSKHTRKALIVVYILFLGLFQLRTSISVEKRVITSTSNHDDAAILLLPTLTRISNNSMSACLLVMDDTIKLTEWLAYHYTVLPLSHLIVAIDPHSVLEKDIQNVLSLWEPFLNHLEVWTNDSWMNLAPNKGWPPSTYSRKGKLLQRRIQRNPQLEHVRTDLGNAHFMMLLDSNIYTHTLDTQKRRQEHFSLQCMRRLKPLFNSWVLLTDTDEFLVYNYIGQDEDSNKFLSNSTFYQRMVTKLRQNRLQVRQRLPPLEQVTIADFIANEQVKPCIKVPGLQMSAREGNLSHIMNNVPAGIDARMFMTLRHCKHGNKYGRFTKCLINLSQVPVTAMKQQHVRTIHNPLSHICGKHADDFIGMDYIASILRLHHYAGTRESFDERLHDARIGRNESFHKRNVEPVGETDDVRPWIGAFVKKVGNVNAQRLFQPLRDAYRDTDWSDVWTVEGASVKSEMEAMNASLAAAGMEIE